MSIVILTKKYINHYLLNNFMEINIDIKSDKEIKIDDMKKLHEDVSEAITSHIDSDAEVNVKIKNSE